MDLRTRAFDALTFDCYGTLVDWERGMRNALRRLPSCAKHDLDRLLRDRDEIERELEAGPYLSYREILRRSLRLAAIRQGPEPPPNELAAFSASIGDWPAFSDTTAALRALRRRHRLAILSNVDRDQLLATQERLGGGFDALVTAEDVRSYKPAFAHFEEARRRLGLPAERVLHVACSPVHDLAPARAQGWRVIWITRGSSDPGEGVAADAVFPDLASLAAALAS